MMGCLLWAILFAISWPIALLFVVIYPLVWLLLLPFSLLGLGVAGILAILRAIIMWPLRFF